MDVNRAGNVFQDGAHFQSQRELCGQFRDMLANGLQAEDLMVTR